MVPINIRLDNDDHYDNQNIVEYIVIHGTGNKTDSDEGNANYFCTGTRNASAHYFVDDDSITQVVRDQDGSWHCGDGRGIYGIHNKNSIGIEMCCTNYIYSPTTLKNTIDLVVILMKKYNVPFEKVVRHYDASRKNCPSGLSANNWAGWWAWKEQLKQALNGGISPVSSTTVLYRVRLTWEDVKSQIGAFGSLDNAKACADSNTGYKVFDPNGVQLYPIVVTTPITIVKPLYRVRLTWEDEKSQIGAYSDINNAKNTVDKNLGYKVFDENGVQVYPVLQTITQSTPEPVVQPSPTLIVEQIKTPIMGKSEVTANQLKQFIYKVNPDAPDLADIYVKMEGIYGVRADIAFCQMCKETNYLRFGGDVKIEQCNPAGLGATGGVAGNVFPNWETGIEAQVQHLFAYGCTNPLPSDRQIVDQRFKYVTRGVAPYVEWLGIQENPQGKGWATDDNYGVEILQLVAEAKQMPDTPIIVPAKEIEIPENSNIIINKEVEPEVINIQEETTQKSKTLAELIVELLTKLIQFFINKK